MPTLADIYSAIDSAKRKGADFVSNPGASLQQMIGYGVDRANAARDQLYQATEEEGIGYGPKTQALAKQMAATYNPIGMTTWHGSPHVFQKFDLSKIGTGEGAQAYGSGMYVAQNPSVAKDYAKVLASKSMTIDGQPIAKDINNYQVQKLVAEYGNDLPKLKTQLDKYVQDFTGNPYADINSAKNISKAIDENKFNVNPTGNLYKVDVPDTHIRRMLDWDAPIKEQPMVVRKLAKSLGLDMNDLGGDLLAKVGKDEAGRKIMQDAGIRGVKYLDQSSRQPGTASMTPLQINTRIDILKKDIASGLGDQNRMKQILSSLEKEKALYENPTRNFVVFDPSHMKIIERNSQPIN
jgi:hypothetical protein